MQLLDSIINFAKIKSTNVLKNFRDQFLTGQNNRISAYTSMKKSITFFTMLCICCITGFAQVIYTTDFTTEEDFNAWQVIDANEDGATWKFDTYGSPSFLYYSYHSTNAANDWMISPAITPTETGTAIVKFKVKGSSYGEKLQVFKNNSAATDGMTAISEVLELDDSETTHMYFIDVEANEAFHLGFQACSDADKWRMYLCNVTVQQSNNPVDLCVTEVTAPQSDFNLSNEVVKVTVKNAGKVAVESFNVAFSVDDTTVATETVSQGLGIGEEMEYTFSATADLSTPRKQFTIKAWTEHADDVNNANDTTTTTVLHKAPATIPYFMGFEADEYTDGITLLNLNNDDGNWDLYTDPWWSLAHTGDYCLAYNYDKQNNGDDWAILEPITISEPGYYALKFWYSGDDTHPEKLGVYYGNESTPEAMTNKIVEYAPFARSTYEESISIIEFTEPQTIYLGFYAFSDKDENWLCVDDVSLEKIESDDVDLGVTEVTNPAEFVHKGTKTDIVYKVRNYGITAIDATMRVKIGENVVAEETTTLQAQEIKEFTINDGLNIAPGKYTMTVEVTCEGDTNAQNNVLTKDFTVFGDAAMRWDFEDGKVPTDFTFRVEDEGTVNPSAGDEFNEYGWGIFNIQEHALYGEHVFAGTSWLDGTEKADRWVVLPAVKATEESYLVWDVASFNPNFLETYSIMVASRDSDSYFYTEAQYVAESADFKTRGLDLSAFAEKNIYIAFRIQSKNCEHLILDNIELHSVSATEVLNVTATTDPAEGKVEKLDIFTVTFENIESIALESWVFYPPYIATVAEDGALTQSVSANMTAVEGQPTKISVAIESGEITEPGKYALVIPRDDLIFNGSTNTFITSKEFVFYYEIAAPEPEYTISVTPAAGDGIVPDTLNEFTVTFEGATNIEFNSEASQGYVVRVNEDGSTAEELATTATKISEVAYKVTLTTTPTESGIYRLVIPAGAVTVTDTAGVSGPNKEFTVDYNVEVSGINEITAEEAKTGIYNINGVRIFKDASQLQKGIYIINGKKTIVR